MKIKLEDALALNSLYQILKDQKMSFKTSYSLRQLNEATEKHTKFYSDEMAKLLEDYAMRNPDGSFVYTAAGDSIQLQPEFVNECANRIAELTSIEVDVPDVELPMSEFEHIELTPAQVGAIMKFIV